MTNNVPEYALLTSGKGFLKNLEDTTGLLDVKYDNVVGNYDIDKADIVYYVYGLLHSPEYRDMYANDLKKSLARIPLVRNKEAFIRIGKELSNLHLNYEKQVSYPGVTVSVSSDDYKVT
ncbi:type ISP restriction/modification enzyme, partial [Virgibacillus salexigens]